MASYLELQTLVRDCDTESKATEIVDLVSRCLNGFEETFEGRTALCVAIQFSNPTLINALLKAGAAVNHWEKFKVITPLGVAVEYGTVELVKLLLSSGADPNIPPPPGGSTALIKASGLQTRYESLKLLVEVGADVNLCSKNLRNVLSASALSHASLMGNLDAVRLLLNHGANPNLVFPSGTALSEAVQEGHVEIVKLLLEHRADPSLVYTEESGFPLGQKTPLEIARLKKRTAIIKLLETQTIQPPFIQSEQLKAWLNRLADNSTFVFNAGAKASDLAELERTVGQIPNLLAEVLQFANGESIDSHGLFSHPSADEFDERFYLMSVQDTVREAVVLADVVDNDYSGKLVPFAANGLGDFLCLSNRFDVRLYEHESGSSRLIGPFDELVANEIS